MPNRSLVVLFIVALILSACAPLPCKMLGAGPGRVCYSDGYQIVDYPPGPQNGQVYNFVLLLGLDGRDVAQLRIELFGPDGVIEAGFRP